MKIMPLAGNTFDFAWEVGLMEWLQGHLGSGFISVISYLSAFGEELVLIAVLGFIFWGYDKKLGKTVGLNVLMGLIWNPMIKNVFSRLRPYMAHDSIKILRPVDKSADVYDIAAQGFSFPSGHSSNSVTLYGSIAAEKKSKALTWAAILLPLLVGFSRVVVGAHYPTDVLAGWLLGILSIALVSLLRKKIKNEYALYGVLLVLTLPGLFYCKSADYFTGLGLMLGFIGGAVLEDKKVRFENTKSILRAILRVLGGAAVYFALNTLLKLPFSKEFLNSGSYASLLVRCARYAVIAFVDFGVYPMLFRYADKLWNRVKK